MMILRAANRQARIWSAFTRLGSDIPLVRQEAVETLCGLTPDSALCLRFAILPFQPWQTRITASVALQRIGDPAGLRILIDMLLLLTPETAEHEQPIIEAFIAIGPQTSAPALVDLLVRLDATQHYLAGLCCRLCATLKNPMVLPALMEACKLYPDLFLETIPAFGEMAVSHLEQLGRDPQPQLRKLTVQTLRRIPTQSSFVVLETFLSDSHAAVRSEVPAALLDVGGPAAQQAIVNSILNGHSTREAIESIAPYTPQARLVLSALVVRWAANDAACMGDTLEAVLMALQRLLPLSVESPDLFRALYSILMRGEVPTLLAATARLAGSLTVREWRYTAQLGEALLCGLTHPVASVRESMSSALSSLGDPIGTQLVGLLSEEWPQDGVLTKLQTLLRGGPDASQSATQALQQMSQWITRLSKETVERLGNGGTAENISRPASFDTRMPGLLRDLLTRGLNELASEMPTTGTSEALAVSVASIKALDRLGTDAVSSARDVLIRALYTVKVDRYQDDLIRIAFAVKINQSQPVRPAGTDRSNADVEVAGSVRYTSALLLIKSEGLDSLPIFLEALYSGQIEVRLTAIGALRRLGDARALQHLQWITTQGDAATSREALAAIAAIQRLNPEMMTLLRGSSSASPDTLLRAAAGNSGEGRPDVLLRPADLPQSLSFDASKPEP